MSATQRISAEAEGSAGFRHGTGATSPVLSGWIRCTNSTRRLGMIIASVASSLPLTFSSEVLRSVSVDSDVLSSVPTAVTSQQLFHCRHPMPDRSEFDTPMSSYQKPSHSPFVHHFPSASAPNTTVESMTLAVPPPAPAVSMLYLLFKHVPYSPITLPPFASVGSSLWQSRLLPASM